jgi:hypothetical protein
MATGNAMCAAASSLSDIIGIGSVPKIVGGLSITADLKLNAMAIRNAIAKYAVASISQAITLNEHVAGYAAK